MNSAELIKLYQVQQKIIKQSNDFYASKPALKKENAQELISMLKLAEELEPSQILLVHSEISERIYVSDSVRNSLQYSPSDITQLSDMDFIGNIHPDDIRSVRLAMEEVLALGKDNQHDHPAIRYKINFRYKLETADYAHLLYEAVTIVHNNQFADVVLVKNMSQEKPFQYVELLVYKRVDAGLVKLKHFIPEQKNDLLTPREKDIIRLLDKGLSNSEMAEELKISVNTVKNHRGNLFQKLQVKSSLQLLTYARKTKLL
jgi:DNA-binding NarL/FixJ family response regulator